MASQEPPNNARAPNDLVRQLRDHLLEKQYRPGDQIETEMELARNFNVSRAKIREATTALCQQGLLHRRPRAGTRILPLDPAVIGEDLAFRFGMAGFDPADAREARRVIETAILPLAIRRIAPVAMRKLEKILERMEANLDYPEKADRADRDFHLRLLNACGNRTLQAFGAIIRELFHKSLRQPFLDRPKLEKALQAHRDLLEAICEEDTDKALRILQDHLK